MTTTLAVPNSKFKVLTRLVGNTPLLSIPFRIHGVHRVLFAKAEYLNLAGSIKNRMASAFSKRPTRTAEFPRARHR